MFVYRQLLCLIRSVWLGWTIDVVEVGHTDRHVPVWVARAGVIVMVRLHRLVPL